MELYEVEEVYSKHKYLDENEINLFEPECIITDIATSSKELNKLLQISDDNDTENSLHEITNNGTEFNCRATYKTNGNETKDCFPYNVTYSSRENTISKYDQQIDLEQIQMHSIFTPEKSYKPKEVFTVCQSCGKYVIVHMCPESGKYSNCKYCLNSPLLSTDSSSLESISNCITATSAIEEAKMAVNVAAPPVTAPPPASPKPYSSFKCDHCGKMFTRNWYLKQHIKLHSNDKPYACDHCDKRFLNSSNLKQHLKTHSVEYRCCLCDKTYVNIESLKLHAKKHSDTQ